MHLYFSTNGLSLQLERTLFREHQALRRRDFRWTEGLRGFCFCLLTYKSSGSGIAGHKGSRIAALVSAISKGVGLVRILGRSPARYFDRVNTGLKDPHAPILITPNICRDEIMVFVDGEEVVTREALDTLAQHFSEGTKSPPPSMPSNRSKLTFAKQLEYIPNVNSNLEHLLSLIEAIKMEKGPEHPVKVKMIALDMECVWPRFKYDIFLNPWMSNMSLEVVMLSPFAEDAMAWSAPMVACSRLQYRDVLAFFSRGRMGASERNLTMELRGYTGMPVLFGSSINDTYYSLSLTSFQQEVLDGGDTPYLILGPDTDPVFREGMMKCFSSWFSYLWQKGESLVHYSSQETSQQVPSTCT